LGHHKKKNIPYQVSNASQMI